MPTQPVTRRFESYTQPVTEFPTPPSPRRQRDRAIAFANFAAGRLDAYVQGDFSPARDLPRELSNYASVYATFHAAELIVLARAVMRAMEHQVSSVEIAEVMYAYSDYYFRRRAPMASPLNAQIARGSNSDDLLTTNRLVPGAWLISILPRAS